MKKLDSKVHAPPCHLTSAISLWKLVWWLRLAMLWLAWSSLVSWLSVALIELFSPSHLDGALLLVPCDMTTSFCRPSAQSPLPSQPLTWLPLGSLLSSLEEENDDSELDSE